MPTEEELHQIWIDSVAKTDASDWGGAIEGFNVVFENMSGARHASAAFNIGLCWMKQGSAEGAIGWLGHWLGLPESQGHAQRPATLEAFFQAWKQNAAMEAEFFRE